MRDEDIAVIRLTNSSSKNNVTYYHFQIEYRFKFYRISCRYSKLRTISALLPKTSVKFPEPCHLATAISTLLGSKRLLEERYQKLTKYFDEISTLPQLSETKGFKKMVEESELVGFLLAKNQEAVPRTPHIRARKVCPKKFCDQPLIVIV